MTKNFFLAGTALAALFAATLAHAESAPNYPPTTGGVAPPAQASTQPPPPSSAASQAQPTAADLDRKYPYGLHIPGEKDGTGLPVFHHASEMIGVPFYGNMTPAQVDEFATRTIHQDDKVCQSSARLHNTLVTIKMKRAELAEKNEKRSKKNNTTGDIVHIGAGGGTLLAGAAISGPYALVLLPGVAANLFDYFVYKGDRKAFYEQLSFLSEVQELDLDMRGEWLDDLNLWCGSFGTWYQSVGSKYGGGYTLSTTTYAPAPTANPAPAKK